MADADEKVLQMHRRFPAPPEIVFETMTRAEHVERWWVRSNATTRVRMDARNGGDYEIVMTWPDGTELVYTGSFIAVEQPRSLLFTLFPGRLCPLDQRTIVSMRFEPAGNETDLFVEHRLQEDPDDHFAQGWVRLWRDLGLASGAED